MKVKARICWLTPDAGGRTIPPSGPLYSTVAKFDCAKGDWKEDAWSLVVELCEPADPSRCTVAEVRFLSPQGPAELLRPGIQFELLEGSRTVATGTIL